MAFIARLSQQIIDIAQHSSNFSATHSHRAKFVGEPEYTISPTQLLRRKSDLQLHNKKRSFVRFSMVTSRATLQQ